MTDRSQPNSVKDYVDKAAAWDAIAKKNEQITTLVKALEELVNAKALARVRSIVSGWNGENRPDGPFEHRHSFNLGARIETCCGHMYQLDEIMQRVRTILEETKP